MTIAVIMEYIIFSIKDISVKIMMLAEIKIHEPAQAIIRVSFWCDVSLSVGFLHHIVFRKNRYITPIKKKKKMETIAKNPLKFGFILSLSLCVLQLFFWLCCKFFDAV
jgi:hypothetical protein